MSKPPAFSLNDMVFIQNIGYGTLMECGNLKSIPIKQVPVLGQKRQSIYFDPQLFNSQSESLTKQKSQPATLELVVQKGQQKKSQQSSQQVQTQVKKQESKDKSQSISSKDQQQKFNIVKVRLEGSNALVYTLDRNIRKYVIVPVRPLFVPAIGTLNIKIQIGKTIQSFKRQIFDLLGLKHAHYFNVKLFTTSPNTGQLNCPGKTIWQYGIRQSSTLTMTAEHGFCFENIPANLTQYFQVTNNNLTFASLPKKPKVVSSQTVIALPPPEPVPLAQPAPNQSEAVQAVQPPQVVVQNQNNAPKVYPQVEPQVTVQNAPETKPNPTVAPTEQKKQQPTSQKQKQKAPQQKIPDFLTIKGDKVVRSGKHYFQARIDKLPQNNDHFQIGISSSSSSSSQSENGHHKWLYSPLTFHKIQIVNNEIKVKQNYGMTIKQNDIIGVLTKIDKSKIMHVYFFKNNVNLGKCFEQKIEQIVYTFSIGSQGQISIDTRAQLPLESYRLA